ncbi:hypothetical protein [Candidatus Wolbachia massiliensis]|uniref:Uncharacterized protein n=1 Tax=Candidatus Wolbachia massiliensis TaxID=1845000 RepID=A0A7M3U271_9RICK|nr:hypothetical protein [Candidatus Wolbachia massiliensis]QOD38506.1 hypothetical protein ID128_01215 [Candidatus Wolbachia massiliensis]
MDNPFKSDNYKENLDSLIKAIKLGNVKKTDEQYNETVRDLSQVLKSFTNEAEGMAKFVIYTDLNNYIEPVDEKPSGLFETLKVILSRVFGQDALIKNDNIRNFVNNKLSSFTIEKAAEYTDILRRIDLFRERLDALKKILDSGRSEKEKHKSHEVNLESKTTSKQKKEEQPEGKLGGNRMKRIERPTETPPTALDSKEASSLKKAIPSIKPQEKEQPEGKLGSNRMKRIERPTETPPPPPNLKKTSLLKKADLSVSELKPEPQKKVAFARKQVSFKLPIEEVRFFEDSGYESLSDEESDKKKTLTADQEVKQQPKKDKPKVPPKPKNLGRADQKVEQKPKVVATNKPPIPSVIPPVSKKISDTDQKVEQKPKVVATNKPPIPPKFENQGHRQSVQKAVDKVVPKVTVVAMKKGVNSKTDSRVKSIVEKLEQNQAKENVNVQPAESKTTTVAQADISVKKNPSEAISQSHSFPIGNKKSTLNPLTAKSDPKPQASKNPLLTHVNVKQIVARFESHGKE